jgi:hypothetical protein
MSVTRERFASFDSFYPYYLREHQEPMCRKLHFLGTFLVLLTIAYLAGTNSWWLAWVLPVIGYGFAWAGHFFFEKNRPATFQYPLWSLMGDFRMFFEILTGRRAF